MAKALKDFIENEGGGLLPVRGALPDMTAETKRYIEIQQAYVVILLVCSGLRLINIKKLLELFKTCK